MPRRRSSSAKSKKKFAPAWLVAIAAIALLLFGIGEAVSWLGSDAGRVRVYRWTRLGNRARIVSIVGKRVHEGLAEAHVAPAQVTENVVAGPDGGRPAWHIALGRDGSPMQVNYQVTRAVEALGAEVLSGRESSGADDELTLTLEIGLGGRPLHEVVIVRSARARDRAKKLVPETRSARVAIVLVGITDAPALTPQLLARHEPFAVAAPAGGGRRDPLRHAIHASGHELVLMVPMEPENYPHVNPGPGTLLVNMPAHKVRSLLHGDLEEAGAVVATANLMGSFATQDEPFMTAVLDELKSQGVPFLYLSPVPRAVCRALAAQLGVAYDEPTVTLDAEARAKTPKALDAAWHDVLVSAEKHGRAIVVLRATPLVAKWLDGAFAAKTLGTVTLVPLSSVIHHPELPE